MKPIYDDEATQFEYPDNQTTQFNESKATENIHKKTTSNTTEHNKPKETVWKRAAMSAGTGVLLGSAASLLMSMKNADLSDSDSQESDTHKEVLSHPEWVDDNIQVATTVNDAMPFSEAFATARAEIGPAGCFEWHGNVYSTYTAEEWNHMTSEQRAEFNDHFSWNHHSNQSSNTATHQAADQSDVDQKTVNDQDIATNNDDDLEIVSIDDNSNNDPSENPDVDYNDMADVSLDPDIEILGIVNDSETGDIVGTLTVDGQEVILIDVDGNMEFDYMASDINNDGQIDSNEHVDIQDINMTVDDLYGFDQTGDLFASNDAPDYLSDAIYEG